MKWINNGDMVKEWSSSMEAAGRSDELLTRIFYAISEFFFSVSKSIEHRAHEFPTPTPTPNNVHTVRFGPFPRDEIFHKKWREEKEDKRKCLRNKTIDASPATTAPAVTLIKVLSIQTSHLLDNLSSEGRKPGIVFFRSTQRSLPVKRFIAANCCCVGCQ